MNKTTHVVTLNQGLPSGMGNPDDPNGTWPTGTRIANTFSGVAYKNSFFGPLIPAQSDTWYRTLNHMGGIDTSGTNVSHNFPPGTVFVKVMWYPNHSNRPGGWSSYPDTGPDHRVWFTGVSVVPEPLAAQNVVTSGAVAGSVEIKVPVSDFVANTVILAPAGLSVTEV